MNDNHEHHNRRNASPVSGCDEENKLEQSCDVEEEWDPNCDSSDEEEERKGNPPPLMCTLKRGSYFCQMRPLAKIWNLKMREVMKSLTMLPASRYYGKSISEVSKSISKGDARRYLSILTILNDKEKSNLSDVDE